jgi:hypothetical protein
VTIPGRLPFGLEMAAIGPVVAAVERLPEAATAAH